MDQFEAIIQQYGDEPKMPEVDRDFRNVISYVQSINEMLENPYDMGLSRGELRDEVKRINDKWRAYLRRSGSEVAVTGTVHLGGNYVEEDGKVDGEFIDVSHEYPANFIYYPVTNVGFAAHDTLSIDQDGNRTGEQRIVYTAMVLIGEEDGEVEHVLGVVTPENIVKPTVDDVYIVPKELDPLYRRHLDFVRHIVANADNEVDATLGLRDVALLPGVDVSLIEEYRSDLTDHLVCTVKFNDQVPYIAEVSGEMSERKENEYVPLYLADSEKLLLSRLQVVADWDENDICRLVLKAVLTDDEATCVRVPLESLQTLVSTRELLEKYL